MKLSSAIVTFVAALAISVTEAQAGPQSINTTSQNRTAGAIPTVSIPPLTTNPNYQLLIANDLGMHCGDLDDRIATILPPFNVIHAQVLKRSSSPAILNSSTINMSYAGSSQAKDPALSTPPVTAADGSIFKTNFWDTAVKSYSAFYPTGVLPLFLPFSFAQHAADVGLPVPDLERLYLGDGKVMLTQQTMPSVTKFQTDPATGAPTDVTTAPYSANIQQPFKTFEGNWPMFKNFPFGYVAPNVNWFAAEGIPMAPFDDFGRENPYPLMRFVAKLKSTGATVASRDAVVPVAGESDCKNCHLPKPFGNGLATDGLTNPAVPADDPRYGHVLQWVSEEWAADVNIVKLHDLAAGTHLFKGFNATTGVANNPVACQSCHYTPALDLLHLGPQNAHGLTQVAHETMSRAMHHFHGERRSAGKLVFPNMPPPTDPRRLAGQTVTPINTFEQNILNRTCYQCHPGKRTQCLRGTMMKAGTVCQDCHGGMRQVGNDFSRNKPGGAFILASDYYTNPNTPRVPWANEPGCGSCHTGDAVNNLAKSAGAIAAPDGIRLLQAYRSGDKNAKPIVPVNLRFAEPRVQAGAAKGNPQLYRLSVDSHGGVFCEGCHGSTHAEWPIANPLGNDNVTAQQMQGHTGHIMECDSCHLGTLAASLSGPHGMHPVGNTGNSAAWSSNHGDFVESHGKSSCAACHGSMGQGTALSISAIARPGLQCGGGGTACSGEGRFTLAANVKVGCALCHGNPFAPGSRAIKIGFQPQQ